jgi:hypothetical protein
MKPLEEYLKPTQKELFAKLVAMYRGRTVVCKNKYILVRGEAPVMLLAHLDTVHKEPVKHICRTENGNILMSPQGIGGDDRCGVYALTAVYEQSQVKPWLLFTCDEEIGGVGAEAFCAKHKAGKTPKELDEMKLLIEIDRKGRSDAVFYDCDNPEFEKYITGKGFETEWGSFSDISYVAPELGVAAVNLSSGYYNAHTQHEYINRKHLNATVKKVLEIVAEAALPGFPKYEYIERKFHRGGGGFGGWGGYRYWDDWGCRGLGSAKAPADEDDFDYGDVEDIPEDIRDEYFALLDFYSPAELDAIREEMGDAGISMLCQSEFGEDYYGMFEKEAASQ